MPLRNGARRILLNRPALTLLGACIVFSCHSPDDADGARGFSVLSDDVERDGWVDVTHAVAGDGATSFESSREPLVGGQLIAPPSHPFFYERGFDAGPVTSLLGDHLLSLSRYRGLVSTRLTGPDAPSVDAALPLGGLPVGMFLSEGIAALLVVNALDPGCAADACEQGQSSRVVLVDVQDPTNLRVLGEQRFAGTLSAARQVGGALHVLSRTIVDSASDAQAPSTDLTWLAFDRRVPGELPAPRIARLEGAAFFDESRLLVLSPGAVDGTTAAELRLADLSEPDAQLSAPVALAGPIGGTISKGDRLRVSYGGESPDIETVALGAGTAQSLGRGVLSLPKGESIWRLAIDGDRAVAMLQPSGQLAVLDLTEPSAPRSTALLALNLADSNLTLAGDRVLAVGRSTLAADAPPKDVSAYGPQALVLVDIADPAAPRLVDRVTLGGVDSVQAGLLELRGDRALFSYYDKFPTSLGAAKPDGNDCGRSIQRFVGYDIGAAGLTPAFAFAGLDSDAQVVALGDDWWVASSVSVSRYAGSNGIAPAARLEITRSIDQLRALDDRVALFGKDFASNAATLDLASDASPLEALQSIDVASAVGLPRVGCDERRRWSAPTLQLDGDLYALRFHQLTSGAAEATLHALDIGSAGMLPQPRQVGLPPLTQGEDYFGALLAGRALLVARGQRAQAPIEPGNDPSALFHIGDTDPTLAPQQPSFSGTFAYGLSEGLDPDAKLSYDVVDVSDPAAPVLASRLDIAPQLATGGFFRALRAVTRDTASGFHVEGLVAGPAVVSGSILVGQHSVPAHAGRYRFYLDRFDFSEPAAPEPLPAIEIPGSVLDFDAETGALITLESLLVQAPDDSPECAGIALSPCGVVRQALDGLVVDGDRATRVGRLLLDTDGRRVVRFAVTHGTVYYATAPQALAGDPGGPFAARDITIERVVLRDGRFERLPSLDVAATTPLAPDHWEQFAARGERALWVSGAELLVADFSAAEPRLERHDIGPWGCVSLDLRGDTAYCAQGQAGYVKVALGQP